MNAIIVSGFLGSGKTTFIKKLIEKEYLTKQVAIIENDFGEINTDEILLKDNNLIVTPLNSGCICCSISGDFKTNINKILNEFYPEILIIEPSGISKLSQVKSVLTNLRIPTYTVTVIDAKTINKYYENFGELFDDQIINCNTVYLSKLENVNTDIAIDIINEVSKNKSIAFDINDINIFHTDKLKINLSPMNSNLKFNKFSFNKDLSFMNVNSLKKTKNNHVDGDFSFITIRFDNDIDINMCKLFINNIINKYDIYRVKGFISNNDYIEYDGMEIYPKKINSDVKFLTIIGKNFDKNEIKNIWSKLNE